MRFHQRIPVAILLIVAALLALDASAVPQNQHTAGASRTGEPAMQLSTNAFTLGGEIPAKFTCTGADLSPELTWSGVPEGAKSVVLIVDDPDAPRGTFTHWLLYDLPPKTQKLGKAGRSVTNCQAGASRDATTSATSATVDPVRRPAGRTATSSGCT